MGAENLTHLPNAELEIMMALWEADAPLSRAQIERRLAGRRNWAPTTVLGFLSRLAKRGYVSCEQHGRGKMNLYTPLVGEREYLEFESESVMGRLCGRSAKHFVAALCRNHNISDEELLELQAFLNGGRRDR